MKLQLRAKNNNWETFDARRRSKKFQAIRAEVNRRDKYTCQYCHFRSTQLEALNIDGNYDNNKIGNLTSCCILCAKCNLLDAYNIDYKGEDKIIYMPEISQEQLNHICRALFIQMVKGNETESYNARMLFSQLQDRATWLDEKTQVQLSHPAMFVHYLHSKDHDNKIIQRLRWLPSLESYKSYIARWEKQYKADADLHSRDTML